MKEIKVGNVFKRNGHVIRVVDICKLETGENGIMFVPGKATDKQIDNHEVNPMCLSEKQFRKEVVPMVLSEGDEVMVFSMGRLLGTYVCKETKDPQVVELDKFDGTLVSKFLTEDGTVVPVFCPNRHQACDFTVAAMERKMLTVSHIINQMIGDAAQYIDTLGNFDPLSFKDPAKLKEALEAQHRRLTRTLEQLKNA